MWATETLAPEVHPSRIVWTRESAAGDQYWNDCDKPWAEPNLFELCHGEQSSAEGESGANGSKGDKGDRGADGLNGQNGRDGKDGAGVQSEVVQYYLSTTHLGQEGGTWGAMPEMQPYTYLWRKSQQMLTNGQRKPDEHSQIYLSYAVASWPSAEGEWPA